MIVIKYVYFFSVKRAAFSIIASALVGLSISIASASIYTPPWEAKFTWQGGWQQGLVYWISEDGSMARGEHFAGKDKTICKNKLEIDAVDRIKDKIDKIPADYPKHTSVTFLDRCDDERENTIEINIGDHPRVPTYLFQYSHEKNCWVGEVPPWLLELYDLLDAASNIVDSCIEGQSE